MAAVGLGADMQARGRPGLGRLVFLLCIVVASQVALALASMEILSGVRAYVMGEALYSRAQKDAMLHVFEYAQGGDDASYQAFAASLRVNLGDRQAREALQREPPDIAAAQEGFLAGRNHPNDVAVLIRLFRWGRHFPFMAEPIEAWADADEAIVALKSRVDSVREQRLAGAADAAALVDLRRQLPEMNRQLSQLQERFSSRLNSAARETQKLLLAGHIVFAVLVLGMGIRAAAGALRVRARAEHEREVRIGDLVNAVSEPVITFDRQGRIVLFNRAAERLFGRPASAAVGRDVDEHLPGLRRSTAWQDAATGDGAMLAWFGARADGSRVPLEVSLSRLETDEELLTTVVARDLAVLEAARQDREARQALEAAARAKNEFLSRVSHELRTPLNAVLGFAQILRMGSASRLSREDLGRLDQIERAGMHLLALVNDVLDLSSLGAGHLQLNLQAVMLPQVIDEALALVSPLTAERGVQVRLQPPAAGERAVNADPVRLRQVLVNLLSNAIKYSPRGSLAQLRWQHAEGLCTLELRDQGAGLSAAQCSRLFEPFNRLGAERSPVEGTGVGLVISRELMQRMNGSLVLHSEVGLGTTVTLALPPWPDAHGAARGDDLSGAVPEAAACAQRPG